MLVIFQLQKKYNSLYDFLKKKTNTCTAVYEYKFII